jgi:hypothetical protein
MKKNISKIKMYPFSPLLLPPFHISRERKTLISTPLPLNSFFKKKEKNQSAPFPPLHNEYNINPGRS